MAILYDYENRTALDPYTREGEPNAVGYVFDKSDITFQNPLTVVMVSSGLQAQELVTDQYCQLPSFRVEDRVQVVFKSGDFTKLLNTTTPLPGPAGPAVSEAVDNGNGTVTFKLPDGSEAATVALPQATHLEVGTVETVAGSPLDAEVVADQISTPGTLAHTAISATYATVIKPEAFTGTDTQKVQAAVDACPPYGTIQFAAGKQYSLTSVLIEKSINIDVNGATITADPTGTGTSGSPVFWFRGTRGVDRAISVTAQNALTVTLTTPADVTDFAVGDWVVVEDTKSIPKWSGGTGYGGRGEVTRVTAIAGSVLSLAKPLEWAYDTAPVVSKLSVLNQPEIRNIGNLTEVDPGGAYVGSVYGNAPHLIHFQHCINPRVSNSVFKGWNLHAVNFRYCVNPKLESCIGSDPYRPTVGGHGYLSRFDRCTGGVAAGNTTYRVRHAVDWATSYDGSSRNNVAIDTRYTAFFVHGVGSKRIVSEYDTALGGSNTGLETGFGVGNSEFNADYDVKIVGFRYSGPYTGIVVASNSQNVEIVNPDIHAGYRGIEVDNGATGIRVHGGTIESTGTATSTRALFVGSGGSNVSMRGVRLRGYCRIQNDGSGAFELDGNDQSTTTTPSSAVVVVNTVTDLRITKNTITGPFTTGIDVRIAPTRTYVVEDNIVSGATTPYALVTSGSRRSANNNPAVV